MRTALQIITARIAAMRIAVRSASVIVVAVVPMTVGAFKPEEQGKPLRQDYGSGPYLYRTFCASCHGEGGEGDGPIAAMLIARPPGLTTIAQRHGQFTRADVAAAIDGRSRVPGHGSADMPVWGDVLKATEGHDGAIIKKRIDALVLHLEAIQKK